jgi:hypothetical protein
MKIWCLLRDQQAHVKPIEVAFNGEADFIYDRDWMPATMLDARPRLVLCVNDYPFGVARCLDAARLAGIPSLVLQDGVLEWRCQYANPLFGNGGGAPQHQPVLADKIACLGHQSARQIAAWGNAEKVEVTGTPRLDWLASHPAPPRRRPGSRILIMTAKNPGFTEEQRRLTVESVTDVKRHLDTNPGTRVLWRLARSVAEAVGVPNQLDEVNSQDLTRVLEQVDAVICTPSTAVLEAMLMGRPVAVLDYHNVPRFVPTAWTIAASQHIAGVVSELLDPPVAKLCFQQDCLADCLWCDGRAAERVCRLIRRMVELSVGLGKNGTVLPADLLGEGRSYRLFKRASLAALYDGPAVFQTSNVESLQVRLARAENENGRLQAENAELKKKLQMRAWLKEGVRQLTHAARVH